MSTKKICIITYMAKPDYCPPLYNTAKSLVEKGYEVVGIFLLGQFSKEKHEILFPGFTVIRISIVSRDFLNKIFKFNDKYKIFTMIRYFISYVEYAIKATYQAIKIHADLYEAHDIQAIVPATIGAKFYSKKFLYRAHELFADKAEQKWLKILHRNKEKIFIRFADLIVAPEQNRSQIYKNEYKLKNKPLTILNCPPYRPKISSRKLYDKFQELNIPVNKIVLYQGLLADDRCIDEIITAAQYFSDSVKLVIIGQGFGRWYNFYTKNGTFKNVLILPYTDYNNLPEYTASTDIGLLFYRNTNRNNYYCAPNKLFEYMMMGLPVVTCNYPCLLDFVEKNEVGLCVNPESPEEITAAVNKLATDNEMYQRMSTNCLNLSKNKYNWEIEFQKFYPEYEKLLHS